MLSCSWLQNPFPSFGVIEPKARLANPRGQTLLSFPRLKILFVVGVAVHVGVYS
jgi:hypothetical protein